LLSEIIRQRASPISVSGLVRATDR
jgi:hypothetical protein